MPIPNKFIKDLRSKGFLRTDAVESALKAVPREHFAPWLDDRKVYANAASAVPDIKGTSSISAPNIVSLMLETLELEKGQRVLEVGTGTGYNTALLAELVGKHGKVTSLDVEAELVQRAQEKLAALGYEQTELYVKDGGEGHAANAPYDRIIVTASVWDIAPAWKEQLAYGGSILTPLHLGGRAESAVLVKLQKAQARLVGTGTEFVSFIPMRGGAAGHPKTEPKQALSNKGLSVPSARALHFTLYPINDPEAPCARALSIHNGVALRVFKKRWHTLLLEITEVEKV